MTEETLWKEVLGDDNLDWWKPTEPNDTIQGLVLRIIDMGEGGKSHVISHEGRPTATPTHMILERKLSSVQPGTTVRITFLGKKEATDKTKKPYYDYKVETREQQ